MARLPKGQSFLTYTEPSFKFWFEEKWYTVQGAETMVSTGTKDDLSTMRSEYTRMRDVAQKRIKRLQRNYPETVGAKRTTKILNDRGELVREYAGFPKLQDIKPQDFAKAFSELAKFVRAKGSTVTGQREIQEKTTKRLNKAIGDTDARGNPLPPPVNPSNYWRVIKQLEEARRQKVTYGSDKMVEVADETLELSPEQFDILLDNLSGVLEHSDEIGDSLEEYMKKKGIEDYQEVDMTDFLTAMKWNSPNLISRR